MRLQDLKDDLDGPNTIAPCSSCRAQAVARRVAGLFEECPVCGGDGETVSARLVDTGGPIRPEFSDTHPCPRCDGSGIAVGEKYLALCHEDDWGVPVFYEYALIRYLFRED